MKSNVHIKGHPLHPILIAFPTAFFTGTLVCDIMNLFRMQLGLWYTASYLEIAGVVMALVAAIPGATDYFMIVPPHSSAKKRGAKHGLLNLSMTILFAFAFALRVRTGASFMLIVIVELLGFVLMLIAGWMGGTLVYRNQIGVYNRFASAGKWKEDYFGKAMGRVAVASVGELKADQLKLLHFGKLRIVLALTEGRYLAFDDHCTHRGGPLSDGVVICGTVQCPWHGSQFDLATGAVKAGPAREPIKTYPVVEADGKVYLVF